MRLSPGRAIALGGLTIGVLDIADAMIAGYVRRGTAPVSVLHSIAAGLLGRDAAVAGGWATAALGLVLHFTIATTVMTVFYLASRRIPALVRQPLVFGPLYGIAVFATMYYVVLPLSAVAARPPYPAFTMINGILIHVFGVGLPAALLARAANRAS